MIFRGPIFSFLTQWFSTSGGQNKIGKGNLYFHLFTIFGFSILVALLLTNRALFLRRITREQRGKTVGLHEAF